MFPATCPCLSCPALFSLKYIPNAQDTRNRLLYMQHTSTTLAYCSVSVKAWNSDQVGCEHRAHIAGHRRNVSQPFSAFAQPSEIYLVLFCPRAVLLLQFQGPPYWTSPVYPWPGLELSDKEQNSHSFRFPLRTF